MKISNTFGLIPRRTRKDLLPISNSTSTRPAEPLTEFAYRKIRKALCEWGVLFFIVIIKFNEELINWNHKGFRLGLKILNSIDFSMNG